MSGHTPPRFPERLATGRLLDTAATRRWTAAERDAKDRMERRELYAGFQPEDEGRSRVRVATCGGPLPEEIAAEIVRRWNAHADLVAACEALVTLWDSPEPFTGADALQMIGEATERARAAIAKAGGA